MDDAIKAMSFQDRANAFAKEYEAVAMKYGVDIGCRLFAQDLWAKPTVAPSDAVVKEEVKPTEDNVPAEAPQTVQ